MFVTGRDGSFVVEYMHLSAYSYTMERESHQQIAELFRLLSHPVRLRILDELRRDEACVCHLQAVLERPQAYVSQQLRVLREAEVVTDRKDGLLVYYRVSDPQVAQLLEDVLGATKDRTTSRECPCPKCSPGNA
jgi:ArsR family transcriptional regulator